MALTMLQQPSEAGGKPETSPSSLELLRRFRLRRDFGLLPVRRESPLQQEEAEEDDVQEWLSSSRRSSLLAHEAYGYSSRKPRCPRPVLQPKTQPPPASAAASSKVPITTAACDEASDGAASEDINQDSGEVELEERCAALEAQLQDLEVQLNACRLSAAETVESIAARQREMGSAVDEHAALSRRIADAHGRNNELKNEALRLQSALAALCTVAPPADLDPDEDDGFHRPGAAAAVPQALAECEALRKKLELHRAHLARLEAENRDLRSWTHDLAVNVR
mmetsp:Transcript_42079/g.63548  ORF Transcript_42079/g.63548 Transcript_42079/m.63548 type:complete len:280 (-) Transcript_42079:16-855(-)